ncbi:putative transporter [Escovopsis weberi]|uniref:Putative transporter n=1 Tax=Escovopsis weberi TaxID=150374 RepID=A0A0M9VTY1_ESCWE|nr:putative transporter [Escovopsis weberi]
MTFDPNGDPENPLEWPLPFKWGIIALLCCMSFTVTFTCISVVPLASHIVADLDHGRGSKSASVLLVTIWELGESVGPLALAPLSEIFGRYKVINAANILFILAVALAAMSQNSGFFIGTRALTGLVVAGNVLNPAVVGDILLPEQRGFALTFIQIAPLLGGAIGPVISGALAQTLGWRKVMWICVALAGSCEVIFLTYFRETYPRAILKRRAKKLREGSDSGADALLDTRPLLDGGLGEKGGSWESTMRPAAILSSSLVLGILSLFNSVAFSFFYVMSVTLPDVLEEIYGLSPAATGSAFLGFTLGSVLSTLMCNRSLDKVYVLRREANGGIGLPEFRLPLSVVGSVMLPLSIALFGWIICLQLPLVLLVLSVAFLGFSLMLASLPIMAYVVDAFGLYSASAITGIIVTRCLMGTFLPLSVQPLVGSFGYGWGFMVLGGISLLLAPIPMLVMRYGPQWRQRTSYTRN